MTLIDKAEALAMLRKHANGETVLGGQVYQSLTLETALEAIAALPARGVRVKPLIFSEFKEGGCMGRPHPFQYFITQARNGRFLCHHDETWHETLEAAQAHAQVAYQSAALAPTAAADELASVAAQLPGGAVMDGIKIKPLVWKQAGGDIKEGEGFSAWPDLIHTPVTIYRKRDGWWLNLDCKTHPTLDAAKAAAQADYEARILSALAPTDAAHVNETPKSEHDGADVLTAAQAREAHLREAAAAVRARYMGDNNREDMEVLRCEAAILALIGEHK